MADNDLADADPAQNETAIEAGPEAVEVAVEEAEAPEVAAEAQEDELPIGPPPEPPEELPPVECPPCKGGALVGLRATDASVIRRSKGREKEQHPNEREEHGAGRERSFVHGLTLSFQPTCKDSLNIASKSPL